MEYLAIAEGINAFLAVNETTCNTEESVQLKSDKYDDLIAQPERT